MPAPSAIVGVATSIAAFVGWASAGPADSPVQVLSWADYARVFGGLDGGELGYAVQAFFQNGGGQAWIVRAGAATPEGLIGQADAHTGLCALDQVDLFNLLCLPDLRTLDAGTYQRVAAAATACCVRRRALALLDPPSSVAKGDFDAALAWITAFPGSLAAAAANAAAYWPEPLVADPMNQNAPRQIASSGCVAGICAATDAAVGVWKAPAGTLAQLFGVLDLAVHLDDDQDGRINPLGLNALRTFPVYGTVVWGARTLDGADLKASDWTYVPVRRLALYIEESLSRGLGWTVFEPNGPALWSAIGQATSVFMKDLQSQGAFYNYSVRCDASTTTPQDIETGVVNLVVELAPVKPAEFIVIELQLIVASSD